MPHERRVEGPFGEYMGYEAGKSSLKPILKIHAITHRKDPILPFSNMGMPIHEGQTATALIKGAEIYGELKKLGLPVKGVFCPPYAVGHMAVVSTDVPFVNFARRVAHAVWRQSQAYSHITLLSWMPMWILLTWMKCSTR